MPRNAVGPEFFSSLWPLEVGYGKLTWDSPKIDKGYFKPYPWYRWIEQSAQSRFIPGNAVGPKIFSSLWARELGYGKLTWDSTTVDQDDFKPCTWY